MKIANYQVIITKEPTQKEKEIIYSYWKHKDLSFLNKATEICAEYDMGLHQLTKLVKQYSYLSFDIACDNCNKIQHHKFLSRNEISTSKISISKYNRFTCNTCKHDIEQTEIKSEESRQKIIDEFKYKTKYENLINKLSDYDYQILKSLVKKGYRETINSYYNKDINEKKFWSSFFMLSNLKFIKLKKRADNRILDISVEESIKSLAFDRKVSITLPSVNYDKTTQELKFRLTLNDSIRDNDSPIYAGTLEFTNEIILKPGIEYTFAGWERVNKDLFITIIPTNNLYISPKQKPISKQPQHIRDIANQFFQQYSNPYKKN